MLRSKRLVIVSHCIMNQNSVVYPLARAAGPFKIVKNLVDEGVGIIQLPCPELRFEGIKRRPMEKHEYDSEEYRELCRNLFMPILSDITMYMEAGYEITGIIGINCSPTCSISGVRGILMEEIFNILKVNSIELKYVEIPSDYADEKDYEALNGIIKQELLK